MWYEVRLKENRKETTILIAGRLLKQSNLTELVFYSSKSNKIKLIHGHSMYLYVLETLLAINKACVNYVLE